MKIKLYKSELLSFFIGIKKIIFICFFIFLYSVTNPLFCQFRPPAEFFGIESGINFQANSKFDFQSLGISNYLRLESPLYIGYKVGFSYSHNPYKSWIEPPFVYYRPEFEFNYFKMINSGTVKLKDLKGMVNGELMNFDNRVDMKFETFFINFNIYEHIRLIVYYIAKPRILARIQIYTGPEIYIPIKSIYQQNVTIKENEENIDLIKHEGLNYDIENNLIKNYKNENIDLDLFHMRWFAGGSLSFNIYNIKDQYEKYIDIPFNFILITLDFGYSFSINNYFEKDYAESGLWAFNLGIKLPIFQYRP